MNNFTPKHNKTQNGIPMYSERGKHAGEVIGAEWRKNIVTDWMLRTPPALAVDVVTLKAAINAGAEWLVITNTQSGITYRTSIDKFLSKGWELNRGFGLQRAMTLPHFEQTRGGAVIHEPPSEVQEYKYKSRAVKGVIVNGKQLPLFGEVK
jgi:hypothetical protein